MVRPSNSTIATCRRIGCVFIAYGPLLGGLLSDRYLNQPRPTPDRDHSKREAAPLHASLTPSLVCVHCTLCPSLSLTHLLLPCCCPHTLRGFAHTQARCTTTSPPSMHGRTSHAQKVSERGLDRSQYCALLLLLSETLTLWPVPPCGPSSLSAET